MLQLHLQLHYLELLDPLNPHLHQAPIQFPSHHSEVFHSYHTESQYTPSICSLSVLVLSTVFLSRPLLPHLYTVQLAVFFLVNCPTFADTKSDRALRSNSSISLHSFSHHLSLA